jgi:hypothetical protein
MTAPRLVFFVGAPRSGSSFTHEVLARHPDVGFVSNVDDRLARVGFRPRLNNAVFRRVPARFTEKGRLRFAPSEGYRALSRRVSPALAVARRDLRAEDATPWLDRRMRAFFAARGRDLPVLTHKFTGWPRIGFLHQVFPDARFVHLVRDGRAVANSLVQMPWWDGYAGRSRWGDLPEQEARAWDRTDRSFVALAGLHWKQLVDACESAAAAVPDDQVITLRFEDVLEHPRQAVAGLLEFCGLEWSPAFERAFSRQDFRQGRREAYRVELADRDLATLDDLLRDRLARYGYPTETPPNRALRVLQDPRSSLA